MDASTLDTARHLLDAGRYDAALRHLHGLSPSLPRRDVLLAAAHLGRREARRALDLLIPATERDPSDAEVLFHLGAAWLGVSDPHRAIRALERVRQLAPDHPGLADLLASAYRRDARYMDAIATVDVAFARGHQGAQLLYEKALSLVQLGDAPGALATYDRILAVDPEHAAAWFGSHAPALQIHGLPAALDRLGRAVACTGANGRYWAFLYAYRRLAGDHDEADRLHAAHIAGQPRRAPVADSVDAIRADLSPDWRLFGLSAPLLRYALGLANIPGLVLEFGVRRGTSINHIAAGTDQTVHGFDSFEGLPEAWGSEPEGVLTTGAELPEVRSNVTLHPGWFEDTLPVFLREHPGPVRFVNIDSDIYSSARTVLTALAPRIRSGTILVFDEFIGNRTWREDEYKAFHEFVAAHDVRYEIVAVAPYTKQVAIRVAAMGAAA